MADLIDRISGDAEWQVPSRPKINLHRFMAAERLYALGECTGAQVAAEFDFQGNELTQATQLKAAIDSQSNVTNKILYVLRAESVLMCIEDHRDGLYHAGGAVNKAKVYEDLQIVG